MTRMEKEYITFAIVTKDTKVAMEQVNPDLTTHAYQAHAKEQAGTPRGSFYSGMAAWFRKLFKKSLRGSQGPRLDMRPIFGHRTIPIIS